MEDSDSYNQYYQELISINATISNFKQLFDGTDLICGDERISFREILGITSGCYTENNSLLYSAESEKTVEFYGGRPSLFVKYYLLIAIGNKKNNLDDMIGPYQISVNTMEKMPNFYECVLYPDYFYIHPTRIIFTDKRSTQCPERKCGYLVNRQWCTACHGIMNASHFKYLMHKKIKFCGIPKNSVLFIKKVIWNVDENDINSLLTVKKFLENDKEKIDIIQARINFTEEKIKRFISDAEIEKKYNEKKIKDLLEIRGGTMENYLGLIREIDEKIKLLQN